MPPVRMVNMVGVLRQLSRQKAALYNGLRWNVCRRLSTTHIMAAQMHYEVVDGVAVVKFDQPVSKVNTLNKEMMEEFSPIIDKIEKDPSVGSVVLISAKPDCFIAGADISMLQTVKSVDELRDISADGQRMLQKIEDSKKPVVAAIMGSCLGGGLEVALAAHYRIAVNSNKTALAVPEVMLGLLPGAGGTQRLPQIISVPNALDMALTGKNIRADKAKRMGLVDQLVDPLGPGIKSPTEGTRDYLEHVAIQTAKNLASGALKKTPRKKNLMDKIMDRLMQYQFGVNYVFNQAKGKVMKQTQGLYPAPLEILNVVKTGITKGKAAGYAAEATAFGKLGMTAESQALIGLFHGQTACKKNRFGKPQRDTKTLAVLGGGLMGAGIVEVSIDKGYKTILKDMAAPALARGQLQVEKGLKTAVKKKKVPTATLR